MQVKDIMTPNPVCCVPESNLSAIANLMCANECGAIPVIQDTSSRKLIGIVTSRDIICNLAQGANPDAKSAQECMSTPVMTIAPEASAEECCRTMEHFRIRRILVEDANGACCGIVSLDEIANWVPNQMTAALVRAVMHPLRNAFVTVSAS